MKIYLIAIIGILIYLPSLKYYFSQDDFIHLYSSHANSFFEFLNFFNPYAKYPDIFFYRPLGTQVYFFINQSLFGLNPLSFRIESLLMHGLNGILFFLVIKKVWKNNQIAMLAAFFYVISASHFLSIFYISAFQQLLKTAFALLCILFFIQYKENGRFKNLFFSLFAFSGALLSKETSVVIPLLFLPIEILRTKDSIKNIFKKNLKIWIIFFIVLVIYFLLRIPGFNQIFSEGEYKTTLSVFNVFQNLKWYLIWTIGLPEILATYPNLKFSGLMQFANDFKLSASILIAAGGFLLTLLLQIVKNFRLFRNKRLMFSTALFFLIPLLPVLVLTGHKYPQYLDLSYLGVFPLIASLCLPIVFKKLLPKILLISSFVILQFFSSRLSEETHWTTHRSEIAKYYSEALSNYEFADETKIVFVGDYNQLQQLSVALAKNYAVYVWSGNIIKNIEYRNNDINTLDNSNEIMIPAIRY